MNVATQGLSYDAVGSSTSGAAMLLILQILPQLDVLKRCRDGWKSIADTAKDEIKTLRMRVARDQMKFRQIENEYYQQISSFRLRLQRAIDKKDNVSNILLNTAVQLQKLQNHSKMIAANFSTEKQNFIKLMNESSTYILTNKEFLRNISTELRSVILNNATEEYNGTMLKNENNFEHEIRHSLEVLAKLIENMKKELLDKNSKIAEATETYNELMEEKKSCLSSNDELQEELSEAKEIEEKLQEVKEEKQELKHINENLLHQILSIVEGTTAHNKTLEIILRQTTSAARGIHKYIVEPAEDARNATLNSILKNQTKEAALISAAKKGNVTEMAILLDYGADIEGEDNSEWKLKPLHWVSDQGHWKAARLLLLRGADVNARSHFLNSTALHLAVIKNHLNVIDLLLKGGADIEARDEFGFTPLFRAINRDCTTAKLLVARGAQVNTTNNKGTTAVSLAADCVRELLCSKGANDPKCRTEDTATASSQLECS